MLIQSKLITYLGSVLDDAIPLGIGHARLGFQRFKVSSAPAAATEGQD